MKRLADAFGGAISPFLFKNFMGISEKITLLNQTTLESLNQHDKLQIIGRFTETGITILGGDFGFAYWKEEVDSNFSLVYKSQNTNFQPRLPRPDGYTSIVEKTKAPHLALVEKEEDPKYDFSAYMKSIAIVPAFYNDYQYGHIVVCFKEEKFFSDEDKSLSIALGNAAAQAITIHRLLKSEQDARANAEGQEARFRALIENSHDGILLINEEGKILDSSHSVNRISGYTASSLVGRNIGEFIHPDNLPGIRQHMVNTLQDPDIPHVLEFRYRHSDGTWRWMEAVGMNMLANHNVGAIVINVRDITERKQSESTIQHQATHDPLTDLANRQEFAARFDQALESAKRNKVQLALMFLDMDRFKNINDGLGHSAGDTVLKVAATRFSSCLRAEDTVARFGGDEFLILVNEIDSPKSAAKVAEKILKAMRMPIQVGEHTLYPTVSIGVALFPDDGLDRPSLKKAADIALYTAKKNGRNRCQLYVNSMEAYASEKFILQNELRQALAQQQIKIYYQPIISLKTRKLTAVEALARWQHPDKGLLSPAEFIPLAEEAGLISALDEYVLSTACGQIKAWRNQDLPKFRIAINFSAQEFSEANFVSNVESILSENNVRAENFEIEITETVAMNNLELTGSNLKAFKKMGFKINIDDFGTGYSSLSYLKSFRVHSLKIDRSFVRHCITNPQDTSIVRTIVSMAHNLNLKVIAEGIEDDQQLDFLASLGCDAAQGFYIGKPMPAEELPLWLHKKNGADKKI